VLIPPGQPPHHRRCAEGPRPAGGKGAPQTSNLRNTTAATLRSCPRVPPAGLVRPGNEVMFTALGSGLHWGAALYRPSRPPDREASCGAGTAERGSGEEAMPLIGCPWRCMGQKCRCISQEPHAHEPFGLALFGPALILAATSIHARTPGTVQVAKEAQSPSRTDTGGKATSARRNSFEWRLWAMGGGCADAPRGPEAGAASSTRIPT